MRFIVRLSDQRRRAMGRDADRAGCDYSGGWMPLLGVALVFGVVNAFVRPVAKLLTFPGRLPHTGPVPPRHQRFHALADERGVRALALGFHVRGFCAAFWGGLVVTIVSTLLTMVMNEERVG